MTLRTTDDLMDWREHLFALKAEAGVSTAQLATLTGVPPRSMHDIERKGVSDPPTLPRVPLSRLTRLRVLRRRARFTQSDVAARLSVSRSWVAQLERGAYSTELELKTIAWLEREVTTQEATS